MAGIEVPKNMVTATTTIEITAGEETRALTTSLTAQTHKLSELEYLIDLAWEKTRAQVGQEEGTDAAPTV